MAARLDEALKELTTANEKLQVDIEQERQQEKLRVDFFRTVSHELKTPIAVLKGELEGMIYQVGEYKDRDAHLRESMRTVGEMAMLIFYKRQYQILLATQSLIHQNRKK